MDCSVPGFPVLHHARLPHPPLSPKVWSSSWPLSWWCYLTILPSATPFSICHQSFPASGSFPTSQLFESGGQSIGALASAMLGLWLSGSTDSLRGYSFLLNQNLFEIKSTYLGVRLPTARLKSIFFLFVAVWSWAGHLTVQSLRKNPQTSPCCKNQWVDM